MSCLPKDDRLIFSYTLHSRVDFFNRIPWKGTQDVIFGPLYFLGFVSLVIFYGFYHGKSSMYGIFTYIWLIFDGKFR